MKMKRDEEVPWIYNSDPMLPGITGMVLEYIPMPTIYTPTIM